MNDNDFEFSKLNVTCERIREEATGSNPGEEGAEYYILDILRENKLFLGLLFGKIPGSPEGPGSR